MSLGETLHAADRDAVPQPRGMDVEESIRANPIDGVVLLMGCDKTTPALLMGAASVDLPTIGVSGGPMLNGKFRGEDIGSGTDVWQFSEEVQGRHDEAEPTSSTPRRACRRSAGHCMTMGTASTMASMVEALGMGCPATPRSRRSTRRRSVLARMAGRRIVEMVHEDLRMSKILTTRGVRERDPGQRRDRRLHQRGDPPARDRRPHRRDLTLDDWDRLGRDIPCLVNLHAVGPVPDGGLLLRGRPAGGDAGSASRPAQGRADRQRQDASGRTCKDAQQLQRRGDHAARQPFKPQAAASPCCAATSRRDGAVIKPSAATPELLMHIGPRGRVRGHRRLPRAHRRRELDIDETCVMVLKNCGPKGYPGHGRGRQHGAAAEGAEEGHHRHGAHLRRAHVGHRLRHGGAAHRARGGGRRAARAGAERRPDRARRAERGGCISTCSDAELAERQANGSRRRRTRRAAGSSSTATTCCRPTRAPTSTSWSASRARRSAGK